MRQSRSQLALVSTVAAVLALAAALLIRSDASDLLLLILVALGFVSIYGRRGRTAESSLRRAPARPRRSRQPW
jgi:hypothetical protein